MAWIGWAFNTTRRKITHYYTVAWMACGGIPENVGQIIDTPPRSTPRVAVEPTTAVVAIPDAVNKIDVTLRIGRPVYMGFCNTHKTGLLLDDDCGVLLLWWGRRLFMARRVGGGRLLINACGVVTRIRLIDHTTCSDNKQHRPSHCSASKKVKKSSFPLTNFATVYLLRRLLLYSTTSPFLTETV